MRVVQTLKTLLFLFPTFLSAGDFAFFQKGSPLQIVGATTNQKDLYSRVIVVNLSTRTILRAQFGWTMTDKDNEKQVIDIGFGPPADLNLPSLEVAKVGAQGATLSILTEKTLTTGVQHAKLKLGVVYVKFQDGTEWRHPLKQRVPFEEVSDVSLVEKISPKVRVFREANRLD